MGWRLWLKYGANVCYNFTSNNNELLESYKNVAISTLLVGHYIYTRNFSSNSSLVISLGAFLSLHPSQGESEQVHCSKFTMYIRIPPPPPLYYAETLMEYRLFANSFLIY